MANWKNFMEFLIRYPVHLISSLNTTQT
jgi:hypothetical protein